MKSKTIWIVVIVVLAAAAIWAVTTRVPTDDHPSVVEVSPEPSAEAVRPAPEYPIEREQPEEPSAAQEAAPEPLPSLDQSDPVIREELTGFLGSDAVAEWLVTDQFVHRVVATIDSLTSREVAPLVLPVQPPEGKFLAAGSEGELTVAEENFARYEPYVSLLADVDSERLASLYRHYYPLFQKAYEDLGYPDAYLNDRLVSVIDHLLATPEPERPLRLVKPEAVYLYADEGLESLSAGQKLLLRVGPENRRIVEDKLRELRELITAAEEE